MGGGDLLITGYPLEEKQGILWPKISCREKSGNLERETLVKLGGNPGILQKVVMEISGNFQLVS